MVGGILVPEAARVLVILIVLIVPLVITVPVVRIVAGGAQV